jgi:hypothetical protein
MSEALSDDDALFATRWVHVFEHDTPEGAVYLPEDADIPLSRRPRERLELRPDGTATLFGPGPDDRPRPEPATWRAEDDRLVVRSASSVLRIVDRSSSRLVIQNA